MATTWTVNAVSNVATMDTFELGVHFLTPGATLYNARFIYYGNSSPAGPKSIAYLGNLTDGSLTTVTLQRPPFTVDFTGGIQSPNSAGSSFSTGVSITGYSFVLVGSYLATAPTTETGISLGNGRDFVALGSSFAGLFGASPTEASLVTDLLASSSSDTPNLNNFFDFAK